MGINVYWDLIDPDDPSDKAYWTSGTKTITVWMKRTVEVDEMKGTSTAANTLNDYLKDAFYT